MKLLDKIHEKTELLAIRGENNIDREVEVVLKGLGFKPEDLDRNCEEFSGGWRMRIELAKILLARPDIFLLDEPTNHLDIESISWLESFLQTYSGAVVLVSHDRAFLDNVTTRTLEISLGKVYDYKVAYSQFEQLHKERIEQQMRAYQNQQKQIKDTEDFIERFRYKATKSVQVQSRIKQLEKLERIEVEEEDMARITVRFQPAVRSGEIVLTGKELTKAYGDHVVLKGIQLDIKWGIMSIDLQKALASDEASIGSDGSKNYLDAPENAPEALPEANPETGEVIEPSSNTAPELPDGIFEDATGQQALA